MMEEASSRFVVHLWSNMGTREGIVKHNRAPEMLA